MGRATRIAICLAAGAVTTFLIAWGLVLVVRFDPGLPPAQHVSHANPTRWVFGVYESPGTRAVMSTDAAFLPPTVIESLSVDSGPYWSRIRIRPTTQNVNDYATNGLGYSFTFEDARGWPFVALVSRSVNYGMTLSTWTVETGIRLSGEQAIHGTPRALGVRPAWRGFAFDTVLFALPWFGLFALLDRRRARARSRADQCIGCGYSLAGLKRCPECGRTP